MKAKVLLQFVDKHTAELRKMGDVIEVTKARFEEILTAGNFIEPVVETEKTLEQPKKATKRAKKAAE